MKHFELFDAVRIVRLPEGRYEIPPYYSQTGTTHIKLGDIGVVIGAWPNDKYRVEAVRVDGAIEWQDHFEPEQLEVLPVTAANFNRRRIHEHWANQLTFGPELLDNNKRQETLQFARKVMAFARGNVERLIERLERSGYRFANPKGPRQAPEEDIDATVEGLSSRGVHVPVALQAWLMEAGSVDFSGTHPEWPRTAYAGLCDDGSHREVWYTDPLVISFDARSFLERLKTRNRPTKIREFSIAPDPVHKANVSGGAPVCINCDAPAFDTFLIGQQGSFTLLSYLRWAFEWSGFPGFDYIADAPKDMLKELGRGLTRL
ncbi:MAG: hypothetical protein L0Y72_26645 [Gemmataceae bacterium]|nr:hypothetical protein [Gemmataceae bacterium]